MTTPDRSTFRSRRPRVNAIVALIIAVAGLALGALFLGVAERDDAVLRLAVAFLVLGLVSAVIGILAGSFAAVSVGFLPFLLSLSIMLQGALLYGAAEHSA